MKIGKNETIHGGGFHHIAIRAYDFEATLKFYIEGLGFRSAYSWGVDGRANGERDSRAVMLDTGDGNYLEVFAGRTGIPGEEIPEGGLLHFALRTSDTAAALERARAAGATVTTETKTIPIQGEHVEDFCIAFCKGLNGEIIEFFQNANL